MPRDRGKPGIAESKGSIALALSGGGFRATLFHLGVIRFLYENDLLGRVQYICSVSGGSILAAHLALNWEAYFANFDLEADKLLDFIRSDVRGRILHRWLLSWAALPLRLFPRCRRSPVALLEAEYADLFAGKSLDDLKKQGGAPVPPPKLSILAASMTTGRLCAFDSGGFRILDREKPVSIDTGEIPVALAVAASSAFPVLFQPVPINHKRLSCSKEKFNTAEYLTDGGVFENLGLWMLRHQHEARKLSAEAVLVSDAQLPFDWAGEARFGLLFARANRTTDVLMKRITEFEYKAADSYFDSREGTEAYERKPAFQRCKADEEIPRTEDPKALPPAIQRKAAMIRTDLNRFSEGEIDALLRHGYTHACRACARARLVPADVGNQPWSPVKPDQKVKPGDLVGSERQPMGFLGWDRYTLGYVPLLLIWLVGVFLGLHWLINASGQAYDAAFRRPVDPAFREQSVENLTYLRANQLTPTVLQAKELLQRMVPVDVPGVAVLNEPTTEAQKAALRRKFGDNWRWAVYLQLVTKMSGGGRPTNAAKCRLVYPRADASTVVGHWVFRVRPGKDPFYQALEVIQLFVEDSEIDAKVYEFQVPPAEPDDYLLVLAAILFPGERSLPTDLKTLIRVEKP
jgi:predicted acylesterase/phospholipase RssA